MEQEFSLPIIPHLRKMGDDWGLGQIEIGEIKKMIEVGKKIDLTFVFAKTVTAMDYMTWEKRTISANVGFLFVYPSDCRDLTDFWAEVDNWIPIDADEHI